MSILLQKILAGKLRSGDERDEDAILKCDIDKFVLHDAIKEARGRGISINCYGDTCNKIVLTPAHLEHDYNYTLNETWGDITYDIPNEKEVCDQMYTIGLELSKTYTVWAVWPDVCGKGYVGTRALKLKDSSNLYNGIFVLFVFTKDNIQDMIKY